MSRPDPRARTRHVSISKEDIEQLLPSTLGWVWIKDYTYSTWVRVAPVWSRAPWVLRMDAGIPIAPCFPVDLYIVASFRNVDTGEARVSQRQRRCEQWRRIFVDMAKRAHTRAMALPEGDPVPFEAASALWEEWTSRTLDEATYVTEEYATVSAGT